MNRRPEYPTWIDWASISLGFVVGVPAVVGLVQAGKIRLAESETVYTVESVPWLVRTAARVLVEAWEFVAPRSSPWVGDPGSVMWVGGWACLGVTVAGLCFFVLGARGLLRRGVLKRGLPGNRSGWGGDGAAA